MVILIYFISISLLVLVFLFDMANTILFKRTVALKCDKGTVFVHIHFELS